MGIWQNVFKNIQRFYTSHRKLIAMPKGEKVKCSGLCFDYLYATCLKNTNLNHIDEYILYMEPGGAQLEAEYTCLFLNNL